MDCSVFVWQAVKKKQLIADGKLGKFGKILETTPASVKEEFGDVLVKKGSAGVETLTAITSTTNSLKKETADTETLAAVTTATPTTTALSTKKRKV